MEGAKSEVAIAMEDPIRDSSKAEGENSREYDKDGEGAVGRYVPIFLAACGLLALLIVGALLIPAENDTARVLWNIIMAILTTAISVVFTVKESRRAAQEDLNRYGLLSWFHLMSLSDKMSMSIGTGKSPSVEMLQGWLKDVAEARRSWQDLLRKVFEAAEQAALDDRITEIKYQAAIRNAPDEATRTRLEIEKEMSHAAIRRRTPIPIESDEVLVRCPKCSHKFGSSLEGIPGRTAQPACPQCGHIFTIHRKQNGSWMYGGYGGRVLTKTTVACPSCNHKIEVEAPLAREVTFVTTCDSCRHHIKLSGTADNLTASDVGRENASFECPVCGTENGLWIAENHDVSFWSKCSGCRSPLRIDGSKSRFMAKPPNLFAGLVNSAGEKLAAGDFDSARDLYGKAGQNGLSPIYLKLCLAMVNIAEGYYETARKELDEFDLERAGAIVSPQILALRFLANNNPDAPIDAVVDAVGWATQKARFKWSMTGIPYLRQFHRHYSSVDRFASFWVAIGVDD